MAYKEEIERKFLVNMAKLPPLPPPALLSQGYLSFSPTVRVRLDEGPSEAKGYLTIKGGGLIGRDEFEYEIPVEEANLMLKLAKGALVIKRRYKLPVTNAPDLKWELDIFEGENEGLVVAELEMPTYDHPFERPEWLGQDVTTEPRYKNSALSQKPFSTWRTR